MLFFYNIPAISDRCGRLFLLVEDKYNKYFNQLKHYESAAENFLRCVYISFTLYIFRDDSSFNFMVSELCFNKLPITFNSCVFRHKQIYIIFSFDDMFKYNPDKFHV